MEINNKRIGVFFCTCNGKVTEKVNYDLITSEVKKLPQVEYIGESQDLCSLTEKEIICRNIREKKLNRIVIVGCVKSKQERQFRELMKEAGANPHLLFLSDIIEECCNVHEKGTLCTSKALEMVKMAVARAGKLEEVNYDNVPVNRKVLVIGGGLAGIETALESAARGLKVILIEKEDKLGGRLARVNTIFGTDRIPAFLLEDKIGAVNSNSDIEVKTNTQLTDVNGNIGDFTAWLKTDEIETKVKVGAIVVAIGVQTIFCPVKYGLGIAENVIGQMKLERLLAEGKNFKNKRISMVVGRSTEAFTLPFIMALKNALLLRKKFEATVNLFFTNMKVSGDNWEKLYTDARVSGVNFFKFDNTVEISLSQGQITVCYEDPFIKGKVPGSYQIVSDYVVLQEELVPAEGTEELAGILRIEQQPSGFMSVDNAHILRENTCRDGIYLVGSCQYPGFVNEIEMSAKTIAQEVSRRFNGEQVSVELTQPYVDAAKCVVCLTCYRCCPHGAITIEHGEDYQNLYRSSARMNPLACRRCGICAAECPGKAIQMPGFTDDQILTQLEAMEV
ncbi:MAG TPA: FAD-dependent oxidoreductase [Desulfobacteria bacterium]|nr:FAD-dependent oxidoreductase [Desulfobacteria bacterium]